MAQAEFHEVLSVDRDKLFQVITQYEHYPKFVEGCKAVTIEKADGAQKRVTYQVSMMKEVSYTLDHSEDAQSGVVSWTLVESDFFKKNIGRWELKSVGPGKTDVRYALELEFKIPVPGLILNRLVKGSLPAMVKSFQKRAAQV